MTREKAIEILKEIIDEGWLISDFEKCVAIDACEMAIKSLEQEPCEDAVSRKAIVEMLNARGQGSVMTFDHFIELLYKLPSVTHTKMDSV